VGYSTVRNNPITPERCTRGVLYTYPSQLEDFPLYHPQFNTNANF